MAVILDTVCAVAYLNGDEGAVRLVTEAAPDVYLPVPVIGELLYGAKNSTHVDSNLKKVMRLCRHLRLAVMDAHTAGAYADIRLELKRSGRAIPVNDLWIAALARQLGLPVASRDAHFDIVQGVVRLNW